jgi:AcrR family transcriptional regulator
MQARALKTKQAILSAARDEFSAKGLAGTRVDVIAERAGVNKQRIYAYFNSKDNLFTEVLHLCMEEITKKEECFLELGERDIPNLAEIILRHYLGLHQHQPYFWRLPVWDNLSGGEHAQALKGTKKTIYAHLEGLYSQGQEQGTFKKDISFTTFMFTLQAISSFCFTNQQTLAANLGLDPTNLNRDRLISECIRLLS